MEILEDDKDWKFTASTCEAPQVDLNGYKENIKKITSGTKIIIRKEQKETSFEEIITELQKALV